MTLPPQPDFLVVSERHGLVPLAHRLHLHQEPAELIIWRRSFEAAWAGKITQVPRGPKGEVDPAALEVCRERVQAGQTILVSDYARLRGFEGPRVFGVVEFERPATGAVRLGCWFDGEVAACHHLLVVDVGAWPGGFGPQVPGGLTMAVPTLRAADAALAGVSTHGRAPDSAVAAVLAELWRPTEERLKSLGFRGLVQADLLQDPATGDVTLGGVSAGWPFLHTQAFLTVLENLPGLLRGEAAQLSKERFVVVVPVSVPPWPIWPVQSQALAREELLEGLTPQDCANYFWHDVRIDEAAHTIRGAGQDGLLGVARGSAYTLELARILALERAGRCRVEGRQLRPDVGAAVPQVLASLELRYGITI